MLRIKADKINELEKFGFIKKDNDYFFNWCGSHLEISKDRTLDFYGSDWGTEPEDNYEFFNIIYKLIKTDIIEEI